MGALNMLDEHISDYIVYMLLRSLECASVI